MKKTIGILIFTSVLFFATTVMSVVKIYEDNNRIQEYEQKATKHNVSVSSELEDVITLNTTTATEGSLISIDTNDKYMVSNVYANGVKILDNKFLMPGEDVTITADVAKLKRGSYVISELSTDTYTESDIFEWHVYFEILDENTLNVVASEALMYDVDYTITNNKLTLEGALSNEYSFEATVIDSNNIAVDVEMSDGDNVYIKFKYKEDVDCSNKVFKIDEFVVDGIKHQNILVSITDSNIIFNYYDSGSHRNEVRVYEYEVKGTILVAKIDSTETFFLSIVDLDNGDLEVAVTGVRLGVWKNITVTIVEMIK